MKKVLVAFLAILIECHTVAAGGPIDTLYKRLDNAIAHSSDYAQRREARISLLKNDLRRSGEHMHEYDAALRLFREYFAYQNDSAFVYIRRSMRAAQDAGRYDLAEYCRTCFVTQLSRTGFYAEGIEELGKVDKKKLGPRFMRDYYKAANHLYGEMASYSLIAENRAAYHKVAGAYRDSLYAVASPDDEVCVQKRIIDLVNNRKYREALSLSNRQVASCKSGTHDFAIAAYYRYYIYERMGLRDSMVYWLALSAVNDVESAVMDQASMWNLAGELSRAGDNERAYNYISYAYESAQKFGTRIRSWQISPLLNSIDRNSRQQAREANRRLTALAVSVSILALLLVVSLFCVMRQRKRVSAARNMLGKANERLSEANARLSSANGALTDGNNRLLESNRVKEEYIGRFIGICAQNMDKKEAMRREVARMLKSRDYDGLARMAKSTEDKEKDQNEFYTNFDNAFLSLFPDFVDDFNALLRPEERLQLSNPSRLNTPLRIYALVRLGIDNSVRISEFLHHSLNTIYNYRARMRNAALGDRDEFERRVKELGRVG